MLAVLIAAADRISSALAAPSQLPAARRHRCSSCPRPLPLPASHCMDLERQIITDEAGPELAGALLGTGGSAWLGVSRAPTAQSRPWQCHHSGQPRATVVRRRRNGSMLLCHHLQQKTLQQETPHRQLPHIAAHPMT